MLKLAKAALLFSACTAPVALAGWAGAAFVDAAGRVGQSLAEWQPRATSSSEDSPPVSDEPESEAADSNVELEVESESTLLSDTLSPDAPAPTAFARPKAEPKLVGIRIRKAKVLALSRSAGIPSGSFVPATGERPAGMLLSGVSGLGVGVQDGDVLTHAAGQPVHSVAQVIGLVAGARHAKAPAISGTLYRGAQRIQLNVEMPYLERRRRRKISRSGDGSAAPRGTGKATAAAPPELAPRAASSRGRTGVLARASTRPRARQR